MKFLTIILISLAAIANSLGQENKSKGLAEVKNIGSNRELFVDYYLIDTMVNSRLELHHPIDEGPVMYFDKPWEGQFSAYCTILKDGNLYRLYYRGIPIVGSDGNSHEVTCYAESEDGIIWQKPELGIFEIDGSRKNNVILANAAPVTHNFSPFIDANPEVPAKQKYKALGGTEKSGLIAFTSSDGIHWEKLGEEPVITDGKFDSQNVAFWSESEKCYVSYFRIWTEQGYSGFRSVGRATSTDFVNWTPTEPMTFGNTPLQHLYTNQTHPYFRAPQIYVAVAARFMPGRQVIGDEEAQILNVNPKYYKDCSDAVFMTSRGGNVYDRTFMQGFITPGIGLNNWVSRTNYPALNAVQTGATEMSVYVNQDYAQPTAHVHRYSLRLDGFSSLYAGFDGGEMLTKSFTFNGEKLILNFSTSAAGGIRIEITDADGKAIKGFSGGDCIEVIGNEIEKEVTWKDNPDLKSLAGQQVRLRFFMNDAHVYSFQFQ
ncbi:MAG: hypothetical protein R2757_17960 [Draconibacterium sp.]